LQANDFLQQIISQHHTNDFPLWDSSQRYKIKTDPEPGNTRSSLNYRACGYKQLISSGGRFKLAFDSRDEKQTMIDLRQTGLKTSYVTPSNFQDCGIR